MCGVLAQTAQSSLDKRTGRGGVGPKNRNPRPAASRCARFSGDEGKLSFCSAGLVRRLHGAPTFGVARCFFCIE